MPIQCVWGAQVSIILDSNIQTQKIQKTKVISIFFILQNIYTFSYK